MTNNKNKVAAVIGASSEAIYAINTAKELGFYTVALDGNPKAGGFEAADESIVVDIRDEELVKKTLKPLSPLLVLPVPIGRYLTITGAVNDSFGLTGVSYKAASNCTDKYLFHRLLSDKGLRNAILYLIPANSQSFDEAIAKMSFPVIAKPRFGSGSRSVEMYSSFEELQKGFLDKLPIDEDFIVETCVEGHEYGVDGAFTDGKFNLILLRDKVNTPPPFCQCVGYYSVVEKDCDNDTKAFITKLKHHLQSCGEILGLTNTLFHADIIRTGDNEPFVIELSARPSGHNLHNLFTPAVTGVDIIREFIKLAVPSLENSKASFIPSNTKHMLIRYFDLPMGTVQKVPSEAELKGIPLHTYVCNIKPGDKIGKVTDGASIMGRGFYVIEASSRKELDEYSTQVRNLFIVN
ncbi:MAG: ATP-grasp domain-containing protein [Butyrivibrio sp.]|nr:ATP-grasp domain-containing protein [Butyrivibrio sp.]